MSTPQPDLAGFTDAQARLREDLGRDVRFYGPAEMIYDPAIAPSAFDDEGFPLDPLAGASAIASAGVGIADLRLLGGARVNVLFQPLAAMRRDETAEDATGFRSRLNKDLICGLEVIPFASGASHFQVGTIAGGQWSADEDELWKIVNAKVDGFGGLQRYIVFGQGTR